MPRHRPVAQRGGEPACGREALDEGELRKLGARVEAFKKVAPTRPHPNLPNEPLPRMAAGPAALLFDRMETPPPAAAATTDGGRLSSSSRKARSATPADAGGGEAESKELRRGTQWVIGHDLLLLALPPVGQVVDSTTRGATTGLDHEVR